MLLNKKAMLLAVLFGLLIGMGLFTINYAENSMGCDAELRNEVGMAGLSFPGITQLFIATNGVHADGYVPYVNNEG